MLGRKASAGVLAAALALCCALPATASSAATVGRTFTPGADVCTPASYYVTAGSPRGTHASPFDGVFTSASFRSATAAPQLKFIVLDPEGGSTLSRTAESEVKTTAANTLNTFPVRMPARTGDVIGVYLMTPGTCIASPLETLGWTAAIGGPTMFTFSNNTAINVSATVELDADGDEYGDETQDDCPTDASTQGQCPGGGGGGPGGGPPQTTITRGAPRKLEKSKVKFKFKSSEPNSTFECKLDKKPYKPCSSPRKVKRLDEGKHKFKVRAIDEAGNVDPSPAKDKFKVVG